MHGFDPNFHFVGMTFNPETFTDLKDKYFLLNGRSYPDTINPAPLSTQCADAVERTAQPMSALIKIPAGRKALLRISDLNVSEYHTLASLGIPMRVIALNARLLRDEDGTNMAYKTNSITLGGGESLDVILDASGPDYASCTASVGRARSTCTRRRLDHLSNDAENFGGMMTEVNICTTVNPTTKLPPHLGEQHARHENVDRAAPSRRSACVGLAVLRRRAGGGARHHGTDRRCTAFDLGRTCTSRSPTETAFTPGAMGARRRRRRASFRRRSRADNATPERCNSPARR